MYKFLAAPALVIVAAGPVSASDKTDVMVPLHQFMDGLSKGDAKSAVAACAEQTSIIDDFPPHEWHGPGACAKWVSDADADSLSNGTTDLVFLLAEPRHVIISADRAYLVVPVSLTYKRKGAPIKDPGHLWTVTVQKSAVGWHITGWTWTTP